MTGSADLRGVLPVLQTPFDDDDRLDEEALAGEIAWVFGQGANGVVIGMVSEVLRLSDEERRQLAELVCDQCAGYGPAVISVGAESTAVAVQRAEHAAAAGAAAVMATPPATGAATDFQLEMYYGDILRSIDLPLVVQDASGYVGRGLSIDLQVRLFDSFGDRVMFKPEAPPVREAITSIMDRTAGQARIFEGLGGAALVESYARGVVGSMPGADVCWAIVAAWEALEAGDLPRAYEITAPLTALLAMQSSLDAFVAIEKHLLVRQQVLRGARCRGPLDLSLDDKALAEADRLFERLRQVVADAPAEGGMNRANIGAHPEPGSPGAGVPVPVPAEQ